MSKRPFNKKVYDEIDMNCKLQLKEIIEFNSDYKVSDGLHNELFKKGDLRFSNKNKSVLFENEVRYDFSKIVEIWDTVHIPIRKKGTPANFYLVWNKNLTQFILIDLKKVKKYWNNVITVTCNHEMSENVKYTEEFIDIPKKETQWYVIGENKILQKVPY